MRPNFTREELRHPKFLAGLLLLAFLAQSLWLVKRELQAKEKSEPEAVRIAGGWRQWHGEGVAGAPYADFHSMPSAEVSDDDGYDTEQSPLLSLVTAAPCLVVRHNAWLDGGSDFWRWRPRIPFLACGFFLGASRWYVARRLCGNAGGFIALTFYCFSPSLIQASAVWHTEPEIVAAWGAFGSVFTAIAVAHTLYAPREVVLWNWRRIVLLGVSLAIAVGAQFSLVIVVPLALGFLLYVAPVRRQAAVVIWIAACIVGFVILFSFYFFHPHAFAESLRRASFWGATWRGFRVWGVYKQVAAQIGRAVSRAGARASHGHRHLCGVAAHSLLRQYCAATGVRVVFNSWDGASACGRRRLPHRSRSISLHIRFRSSGRSARNPLSHAGDRALRFWAMLGAYVAWDLLNLAQVPVG